MAFPTLWKRKCPVVIQAAQVSSDLTDFPVLFNINKHVLYQDPGMI